MAGEAKQLFDASEVALHSSRKDCWVAISGKVSEKETFLVPFSWFTGGDRDLIRLCQTLTILLACLVVFRFMM